MSELLAGLEGAFTRHYGASPAHVAKAPGRVNLIGEHTDYNDGLVMPCALEFHTLVAITPRSDRVVNTLAVDWQGETDSFSLDGEIAFHSTQAWSNYIRGVANEMRSRGHSLSGCDVAISGNVPQGAGLSSSAALEVALVQALAHISNLELSPVEIAAIGRAAENNFVGCACGIMDQLIAVAGREGYALAIDCRSLELAPLLIPEQLSLLLVNSSVRRGLVDSEYNLRRAQCEQAAAFFGCASLRDVSLQALEHDCDGLDPVAAKRARHVLQENERVLAMQAAFRTQDVAAISRLMAASHASMRELFEITTPEIDLLVDTIAAVTGSRGGVRMTGGGFGGCVVALLPDAMVDEVIAAVARVYNKKTGLQEAIYYSRPAGGVGLLY
ncbi:MAG: galactokinase [Halioglobus sp.]|nr:galactokinase [Halioglobus sp.]